MNITIARLLAAGGMIIIIVAAVILAWPPTRLALMIGGDWGLATSDPVTQLGLGLFLIGLIGYLTGGTTLRVSRAKRIAHIPHTQPTDHSDSEPRTRAGLTANHIYLIIEITVFIVALVAMVILKAHESDSAPFGLSEQGYLMLFFASCALACVSLVALLTTAKKIK